MTGHNHLKLKKHTPKIGTKYPGLEDSSVHIHPPIKKKECPYCTFVNEDGSHKQRGKNFASREGEEVSITDKGEIYFKTWDDYDFACVGFSIKIPNCPFCKRKL